MKLYHAYNTPADDGLKCTADEGKTQQHFAEECDINEIVRRFGITGKMPENLQMPQSGDFTNVPDYHTAMNIIARANQEFHTVPADIRKRFNHDPQELIMFLEDDSNRDEATRLGLIKPPAETPRDVSQSSGANPARKETT